jgi:cellulose synthase/poly-beta-1,6-N-acetylglucosamine synthase-like glycosyltransferase
MLKFVINQYHWANRHAGMVLIGGLIGVYASNYYQWKKKQKFTSQRAKISNSPPSDQWSNQPKVSLLVAAWNEAAHMQQHIHSYRSLRYPSKELIICAGGNDETFSIAKQCATEDVVVLPQSKEMGKQGALRECFINCSGKIIYLTDADCMLDDQSFENVIYPIISCEENACSGGSLPFENSMGHSLVVIQAASDYIQFTDATRPQYYPGLFGRNSALSKKAILSTGEFLFSAPTGTDYALALQLDKKNIRIKQIRNSLIRTEYSKNPANYIQQKRRWHRNVLLYSIKYRNLREFARTISLSLIALAMLFIPLCSLHFGPILLIIWILLLLKGLLSRRRYLRFLDQSMKTEVSLSSLEIIRSLFLDFIAWSLGLLDLFLPRNHHAW